MTFCDIGVNLTNKRFHQDLNGVLAEARLAGVDTIIITGTNEQESAAALALTENTTLTLYSTAGVHPHDADAVSDDWLEHLRTLLASPQVVAVGECGLDFNRNYSSQSGQRAVFAAQLQLAKDYGKPVFLHERDAFEEQIALLQRYQIDHGVAHCFTGNARQMQTYLSLGLYIGITGWVCDPKRGIDLQNAVAELPMDRLLLETDAPYLLPKTLPNKVRRNEPKFLPVVAQTVAEIKGVTIEDVAQASYENAQQLFAI
ncbi:MAG: TatD family hydrolase [Aestuariibacter sp.]